MAAPEPEPEPERCAICLGPRVHEARVDGCFHAFCLACVRQWASVSRRCPLCARPFRSLLHGVDAASGHYERTWLPASTATPAPADTVTPDARARRRRHAVYARALLPYATFERADIALVGDAVLGPHATPREVHRQRVLREKLTAFLDRELPIVLGDTGEDVDAWQAHLRVAKHLLMRFVGKHGANVEAHGHDAGLVALLGAYAEPFVRELTLFLSSPYSSLSAFDAHVAYTPDGLAPPVIAVGEEHSEGSAHFSLEDDVGDMDGTRNLNNVDDEPAESVNLT